MEQEYIKGNRNTQIFPKVGAPYYEGDQVTCNTKYDKQ